MSAAATVRLPAGWARACDFPRVQIALTSIAAASALLLTSDTWNWTIAAGIVLATLITAQQLRHILPYTRLWPKQSADSGASATGSTLKVLVSNVLQTNTRYELLVDQIEQHQPDIVVVMEVDESWIAALREVTDQFPYKVEVPLDNKYGIALYSKLKIDEDCVNYLVRQGVPSLVTTCRLSTGRKMQFIAVHPEPPMPHEGSVERDAEIVLAGLIAAQEPLPTIITGDLNDVAWSHTTRRFRRISGLLDPRIGRGMYNTFHASIPVLRWPLDHLFHDPAFTVKSLHRLPYVGSDHFPIMFELALLPADVDVDATAEAVKTSDAEEANELLDSVPDVNTKKIKNTGTHKVL
ncbi:MAG: endonuclease/exonuclease/phosphatase family protein [Anderseniella sp.]|nr:endonuclease/exonuclease/phosphatase family protein [Anderseniella sp.]